MFKLSLFSSLAAFCLVTAPVQAETIDFRGSGGNIGLSEDFTSGAFTATATFTTLSGLVDIPTVGNQNGNGLGAIPFSGLNLSESIILDFGEDVVVNQITLVEAPNRLGGAPIAVFLDGLLSTTATINGPTSQTVSLFNTIAQEVRITRTGLGSFFNAVRLQTIDISAIPVPAAVWLFGTVLAGLGVGRRYVNKA